MLMNAIWVPLTVVTLGRLQSVDTSSGIPSRIYANRNFRKAGWRGFLAGSRVGIVPSGGNNRKRLDLLYPKIEGR